MSAVRTLNEYIEKPREQLFTGVKKDSYFKEITVNMFHGNRIINL